MRNVVSRTNVDHAWARARVRQVAAPGTTLRPSGYAWRSHDGARRAKLGARRSLLAKPGFNRLATFSRFVISQIALSLWLRPDSVRTQPG